MGVIRQIQELRICIDLTRLNESVCRERHILSAMDDTPAKLDGAVVLLKLDATLLFWQIFLHKVLERLTTFITPSGRYCFRRLPFGKKVLKKLMLTETK